MKKRIFAAMVVMIGGLALPAVADQSGGQAQNCGKARQQTCQIEQKPASAKAKPTSKSTTKATHHEDAPVAGEVLRGSRALSKAEARKLSKPGAGREWRRKGDRLVLVDAKTLKIVHSFVAAKP
jgi:Ni/Co efflux regulator RcnB